MYVYFSCMLSLYVLVTNILVTTKYIHQCMKCFMRLFCSLCLRVCALCWSLVQCGALWPGAPVSSLTWVAKYSYYIIFFFLISYFSYSFIILFILLIISYSFSVFSYSYILLFIVIFIFTVYPCLSRWFSAVNLMAS